MSDRLSFVAFGPAAAESIKSWTNLFQADTGTRTSVAVEGDIVKRFRWVKWDIINFTAGFGNETTQMLQAERAYLTRDAGPFQVRIVWSYSKSTSGFFVRSDSAIRTPQDIKPGMRVADMSSFLSSTRIVDALLAWAGLKRSDLVWVPTKSAADAANAVIDGRVDLSFGMPRTPHVQQADRTPPGIAWINLNSEKDPEGAARFKKLYPLINFGDMTDSGLRSTTNAWGTEGINYLVTREETPADTIYAMVKWLDENHERYRKLHADNRNRDFKTLVKGLNHTYMPCHNGLVRYLKEKGVWTPAHERRHQANVQLIERYITAYQEAVAMADEKQIPVSPDNEAFTTLWKDRKKQLGLPSFKVFDRLEE